MAQESRTQIKTYFETNDFPTQGEFENAWDSFVNILEDSAAGRFIWFKNGATQYNSDADAVTAGLAVGEYYPAGDGHEDGVRQGSPCKILA